MLPEPPTLGQFAFTIMKLHLATPSGQYLFTGYDADNVFINRQAYQHSLIVTPQLLVTDWGATDFASLREEHFQRLLQLEPELVVFGTGKQLQFPHPSLYRSLTAAQIGVEFMDSHAAARTYNILMAEDRRVVCGILFDKA